jgi:GNAT superfamily N-acetyltransferase
MVDIREVPRVEDLFGISDKLLREHWDEVALNKHLMVLNPDWEQYQKMCDAGVLLSLAAYDNGELVGYSINVVTNHPHYKHLMVLRNDLLFVSKQYRNSSIGMRLMSETEEKAKSRGVKLVLWHAKQGTALDYLLSRRGYMTQDIIYSKEI